MSVAIVTEEHAALFSSDNLASRVPAARSLNLALLEKKPSIDPIINPIDRFIRETVVPGRASIDTTPSRYLFTLMKEHELLGLTAPTELGGAGLTKIEYAHVVKALAKACPGAALSVFAAHTSLCIGNLLQSENEELKKRLVPMLASGEYVGAWAFTEPAGGSQTFSNMAVRVKETREGFRVTGEKVFITNGTLADVIVAYGVLENGEKISFVVNAKSYGVTRTQLEKVQMKGSDTALLRFDNVLVLPQNIIARGKRAQTELFNVLNNGRMVIAAHALGVMEGAIDEAEKAVTAKAGWEIDFNRRKFRRMNDAFLVSKALTLELAQMLDKYPDNQNLRFLSAHAKIVATENAARVCDAAMMTIGGIATDPAVPVASLLLDSFVLRIGEGSNDVLADKLRQQSNGELGRDWAGLTKGLILDYLLI